MKPVLVLQHLSADGPAYLRDWLLARGRSFELCNTELGQAYPRSVRGYAALAVLGGEMSANDPLPSLRDAERLIAEAMQANIPVLGHCLGGQLMARVLGAAVGDSPSPEIGWHSLQRLPGEEARAWLGEAEETVVFQWHYDAFELPSDARLLARSPACPHQAFSVGPHLAMQFHVELDAPKLAAWTAAHDARLFAAATLPTVQSPARMNAGIEPHLANQQRLADRIYARWLSFVKD